jgi:ADP-glucose pyrophosphorylase
MRRSRWAKLRRATTGLHPLTAWHSSPSVPSTGKHRIVDLVLSNLVNIESDSPACR